MAVAAFLIALLLPLNASADGGVVRVKADSGPFTITLFSPEPLRHGPVDLSVLVQARGDGEPVFDVDVELVLERPDRPEEPVRATASRRLATNKLLQAAVVDLDEAGPWRVRIVVRRGGGTLAEAGGEIQVAAAQPPLLALWPLLVLPAAVVALFALGRWLRSRQR